MAPGPKTKRSQTESTPAPISGEYRIAGPRGGAKATVVKTVKLRPGPSGAFSFRGLLSPDLDTRLAITNGSITGKRVRSLRTNLDLPIGDVARVLGMSERNMMRREQGETALSVADADRAYRLARVADLAVELLGDTDRAKAWLKSPHRYLGGETPVAMIETEIGTDLVIESLYAIAYGGVA